MSEVVVRPVTTEAENQAFLRLPWKVYEGDPGWAAPLWKEHVEYFEPEHNPELRHLDLEKFVAWRGDQPVGTIIAYINQYYNDYHKENLGWFGQFEFLEDEEAAHALLASAEAWVRERGATALRGPASFSTNSELGMLVEGFEHPNMIMTLHANPYYHVYTESAGYGKAMDLLYWYFNGQNWGGKKADKLPEKLTRVVEKLKARRNYTVHKLKMRDFDKEVEFVKEIYLNAWSQNWSFVPMDDDEIEHMKANLKQVLDPNIVVFIENEKGERVAFAAPFVDLYEPLRKAKCKPGEPEWLQLLRLVWHWKIASRPTRIRVALLGIVDGFRGTGIDAILYYELMKAGLPRGYVDIEMSWILETNDMMNRGIQMLGGEVYKVYRMYEKQLTS